METGPKVLGGVAGVSALALAEGLEEVRINALNPFLAPLFKLLTPLLL